MQPVTRRTFVTAVGAFLLPPPESMGGGTAGRPRPAPSAAPSARPAYGFFDAAEARFIEAACDRLIPADASGPGAREAGVAGCIDAHLRGAWGTGERWYRDGSWQAGTAALQAQSRLTPAGLFRTALGAINRDLDARGVAFGELPAAAQDEFLAALESGAAIPGVPTALQFSVWRLARSNRLANDAVSRRPRLFGVAAGRSGSTLAPGRDCG